MSQDTATVLSAPQNTAKSRSLPPEHTRWRPGRSGNPGGRPKGIVSYIRSKTKDGREITDFLLGVMRGQPVVMEHRTPVRDDTGEVVAIKTVQYEATPPLEERREAAKVLLDRGWGKPAQPIELDQRGAFLVLHKHWSPGQDPLAEGQPTIVPALPAGQPT